MLHVSWTRRWLLYRFLSRNSVRQTWHLKTVPGMLCLAAKWLCNWRSNSTPWPQMVQVNGYRFRCTMLRWRVRPDAQRNAFLQSGHWCNFCDKKVIPGLVICKTSADRSLSAQLFRRNILKSNDWKQHTLMIYRSPQNIALYSGTQRWAWSLHKRVVSPTLLCLFSQVVSETTNPSWVPNNESPCWVGVRHKLSMSGQHCNYWKLPNAM